MNSFTNTASVDMETAIMRDMSIKIEKVSRDGFAATVAFAIFALILAGYGQICAAAQPRTKTFPSAEEASHALYLAVKSDDDEAMSQILGAGKEFVSSDDEGQERLDRDNFAWKYQEMHRLVQEPDAITVLYIGAENWPFPIPLVSEKGAWHFDAKAGMEEVLFRRVGENELTAMEACHGLVVSQKEHKGVEGDPATQPIRGLRVHAGKDGPTVPFHGYYFRKVMSPVKSVEAGARFAFLAYPAEYRSTGVMTYAVTQDDVVYEKDLGPNTEQVAKGMTEFNPDSTWHPAD